MGEFGFCEHVLGQIGKQNPVFTEIGSSNPCDLTQDRARIEAKKDFPPLVLAHKSQNDSPQHISKIKLFHLTNF